MLRRHMDLTSGPAVIEVWKLDQSILLMEFYLGFPTAKEDKLAATFQIAC